MNLKKSNPEFPILIRECSGVQARIWARYGESAQPSLPDHRGPRLQCTSKAEVVLVVVVFQSWLQRPTWNLQNHPSSSITFNDLMMCCYLFVFCADFGKEKSVSVDNMSADQVASALQTLVQPKP